MYDAMPFRLLAQIDDSVRQVTYACLVLLVLLIVGLVGVSLVRRWMKSQDDQSGDTGFSLSELRRLQKEGKLSDQEYQKAMSAISGAVKRQAERGPVKPDGKRNPPK